MVKKIKIDNETNELDYLFGGYFSVCGKIDMVKKKAHTSTYYLPIRVSFDEMRTAKLFQKRFGGFIRQNSHSCEHMENSKITRDINCRVSGGEILPFLKKIKPFIIGKRMQKRIEIAIGFRKYQMRHFNQKTDKVRKERHKYYLRMRRLR